MLISFIGKFKFQFLHGAIKRASCAFIALALAYFNSYMVRLKVDMGVGRGHPLGFQFLHGAIKRLPAR